MYSCRFLSNKSFSFFLVNLKVFVGGFMADNFITFFFLIINIAGYYTNKSCFCQIHDKTSTHHFNVEIKSFEIIKEIFLFLYEVNTIKSVKTRRERHWKRR
ncbi:CLUMA_CG014574, isoform A [Clunio marinus]|uniref:CLUMA_CG014574, isoform A n=1 Tax=Clunio marinus TaxID=568069 RepID=A0A1J1ILQ0_9DIPT|nr:CLUMA_CG014574, isoform A [Clunio marinus]